MIQRKASESGGNSGVTGTGSHPLAPAIGEALPVCPAADEAEALRQDILNALAASRAAGRFTEQVDI
jgi:hypothetical protein